jgi:hypothetical protein
MLSTKPEDGKKDLEIVPPAESFDKSFQTEIDELHEKILIRNQKVSDSIFSNAEEFVKKLLVDDKGEFTGLARNMLIVWDLLTLASDEGLVSLKAKFATAK